MRYLKQVAFLLLMTAALTCGQALVKLNGSESSNLSNNLTENSLNQTNGSLNATDYSTNVDEIKSTSSDLWSWGTKPKYNSSDDTETNYLSDPSFDL
jgi:hypothetical protein